MTPGDTAPPSAKGPRTIPVIDGLAQYLAVPGQIQSLPATGPVERMLRLAMIYVSGELPNSVGKLKSTSVESCRNILEEDKTNGGWLADVVKACNESGDWVPLFDHRE
jgi:hypothetical protein